MRVLVVEDERDLARALAEGIRRDGYAVDTAFDGREALDKLAGTPYDIVCLDLNLPDMDGLAVCRSIRAAGSPLDESDPPRVIMLTARDALSDRVAGLDSGADDFMVKPFALAELLARLRALSRRRSLNAGSVLQVGRLSLDSRRRTATADGRDLGLTSREFALLRYFMLHPGEVLAAERLLDHVWDENIDPFTNTVRVTVSKLRKKLADAGCTDAIETVVGSGYRLVA
ncbi:MAG TPA: response regulator transcription factor [Acidimicrobiia bacterium]|nr:response regulator transcription factor [Acidimicrobiia bacterium]